MKRFTILIVTVALAITLLVPATANATQEEDLPTAGECMMQYAKKYIGSRYKLGGKYLKNLKKKGDKNRVDCTGFVKGILKRYSNIKLRGGWYKTIRRSAYKNGGVKIGTGRKALKKAMPGDLIIYSPERGFSHHFGFYYGKIKGKHRQIDSSPRGHGVSIRKITRHRFVVIRFEKKIKAKSKKYKKTIDRLINHY